VTGYDPLGSVGGATSAPPEPRIRLARPVTGEEEVDAVRAVLESGYLTNGPATRRFEAAMAARHDTAHAVAFANGTVALAAMYLAAGIGPGDEVIVPSFTFISTATSVLHVGATPVFADIDPETFCLDPADVARRVTPRTRAIVPVHYAGQAADIEELAAIAGDAGADLLEDAAEAHGASYRGRPVGSWGRAGMFSFTPTKNITTGEGGIVTTDDEAYADRMRRLRNHGMRALYVHDELGFNWRLSDIQAAVGACQVDRLDAILAAKRGIAGRLDALLAPVAGVRTPVVRDDRDHTYMLYTVRLPADRRDAVRDALADVGIETRVYFPPAHRQPVFAGLATDLPVTDEIGASVLSLPVHARLTPSEVEEVAAAVAAAV
jgi:perosamine synthetase